LEDIGVLLQVTSEGEYYTNFEYKYRTDCKGERGEEMVATPLNCSNVLTDILPRVANDYL
jgi:hypothetical protein